MYVYTPANSAHYHILTCIYNINIYGEYGNCKFYCPEQRAAGRDDLVRELIHPPQYPKFCIIFRQRGNVFGLTSLNGSCSAVSPAPDRRFKNALRIIRLIRIGVFGPVNPNIKHNRDKNINFNRHYKIN